MKQDLWRRCRLCSLAAALSLMVSCPVLASGPHPAPETLSPQMTAVVNAAPVALWGMEPETRAELEQLQHDVDLSAANDISNVAEFYQVEIKADMAANLPVYYLTPKAGVSKDKADKIVLFIHGGGYIFGQGLAGVYEALPLSGLEGYKVICVDYHLAPAFPYPQAINDTFAVYRELLKTYQAQDIAVFGSSTGGAMTLVLALQALDAGVEVPGALIAGSPWAEMGKKGDTYVTHDGLDNVLGSYDHLLRQAALAYANGADMSDPYLSPVNATDDKLKKFPPTLLISGTRDLFLSNTARMHLRLLQNKVPAELIVYEGLSHVQYYYVKDAPETNQHYRLLGNFLKRTLLHQPK